MQFCWDDGTALHCHADCWSRKLWPVVRGRNTSPCQDCLGNNVENIWLQDTILTILCKMWNTCTEFTKNVWKRTRVVARYCQFFGSGTTAIWSTEMSGLWNFSVWVQSWSDKIESDPVLIRKILENHQSDPVLIRQCKTINFSFASWDKRTARAILPLAYYDWLKAK